MRLLPLFLTVFIDSFGFGLVFPIFSPLIMNESNGILPIEYSLSTRGFIFGVLLCSFCLGQFFGSPILGALSDRKGRKKILLITLWMGAFGYLFGAISILFKSVIGLFFSRFFCGVAAGNYPVAQSTVVDCSEQKDKSKNFSLLGTAWGTGFIIGPFIGGKLSDPNFFPGCSWTTPFFFASALCLLNVILLVLKLKESLPFPRDTKLHLLEGVVHVKKAFKMPQLKYVFLVMAIFSFGWSFFTEFSPIFLMRRFGFEQGNIGNFYACVGIWVALSQGIFTQPFIKRFPSHQLLLFGLLSLSLILPVMLFFKQAVAIFWILPFLAFSEAFIYPTASALVSDLSPKEQQGEMLGINNSVQWAAIGISPLCSGTFVALYPHLPLSVSSVTMFIAFLFFLWVLKKKKISLPTTEI